MLPSCDFLFKKALYSIVILVLLSVRVIIVTISVFTAFAVIAPRALGFPVEMADAEISATVAVQYAHATAAFVQAGVVKQLLVCPSVSAPAGEDGVRVVVVGHPITLLSASRFTHSSTTGLR
jgi:hypothetical protein